MLLWTQLITLWPILFNAKSFVLCAPENAVSKILDVILKKIQKRSLETLGNETHVNEDNELLEIEHKLQKAARPLGDEGKKYVKLILREIQSGKSKKKSNNGDNKRKSKNIAIMALESDENSTRLSKIDYLIKKINRISLESVSNFTNAQMGNVLNTIEKKLKKAAAHLGDKGEKYVNLIMRGIQNTYKNTTANYALSNARRRYLENISKISSDVSNNYGNKEKLDAVEKKLKLAAQRLGKNGKKYVNIIMKAVRSDKGVSKTPLKNIISTEVEKVVENAITLNNVIKTDKYNNILRKQAVRDVANEIEKLFKTFYKSNKYLIEELQLKTFEAMKEHNMLKNSEDVKFMSDFIVDAINAAILFQKSNRRNSRTRKVSSDTKSEFQRHTTKRLRSQIKRCKNRVNITCSNIKSMNSYTCAYDDQIIPIIKLCDGKDDCFDSSDETFCVKQTIEKLRFAHEVLAAIDRDLEYKCLTSDIDEGILSKQNLVLRDVLKTQSDLIEKYKSEHLSESNEEKATSEQ
ncbi:unnamed protein product [Leptosia nina]|uniref:Uncharacterized protein n=1 Tax=Leptosia nina TaxID=320188 RepID=A0AAV1IYB9_9NEOP